MFYGIVFGAIWWVMKHDDVDTNGRGEFHKRLLDNMV
jgi:hypothetical protein